MIKKLNTFGRPGRIGGRCLCLSSARRLPHWTALLMRSPKSHPRISDETLHKLATALWNLITKDSLSRSEGLPKLPKLLPPSLNLAALLRRLGYWAWPRRFRTTSRCCRCLRPGSSQVPGVDTTWKSPEIPSCSSHPCLDIHPSILGYPCLDILAFFRVIHLSFFKRNTWTSHPLLPFLEVFIARTTNEGIRKCLHVAKQAEKPRATCLNPSQSELPHGCGSRP